MPKKNAPEFSYDEKTKLYRKKIKNPNTGKWVPVYGRTKAECRAKIKEKEAAFGRQLLLKENPLVWQYAQTWYKLHTGNYSQKRKDDYRNAINNHICPVIGEKLLREVTYSDIKKVMAKLDGRSKSLQQKVVTTLRRIFEAAVKDRYLAESPCAELKAEGKQTLKKDALTKAQQQALLETLAGTNIYPFVMICLYSGLRREEALGLQWTHVHLDDDAPHIDVRTSCNWEGRNKPVITEILKSDAAWRSIPIPPQLVAMLRAEREKRVGDFVIATKDGEPLTATGFRKRWDAIRVRSVREISVIETVDGVKRKTTRTLQLGDTVPKHPDVKVGIDFHVTPHKLRRTYVTELILAGVAVKRVQYLAGHKNATITLEIYTALMENRPEDLMAEVLRAFG